MGIKLGNTNISRIYAGNKEVVKVMLGDTVVYTAVTPATYTVFTYENAVYTSGQYVSSMNKLKINTYGLDLTLNLPHDTSKAIVITDNSDNSTAELYAGNSMTFQSSTYSARILRSNPAELYIYYTQL